MNIDRNMLISYDTFNSWCAKRQKTAFFVMNFIKIVQNHSLTKIRMTIEHTCHLCVIWQHYPCNMYIHLHTIGLTGATELGTVTYHFAPNQRRFQWSISRWILLRRNNIFVKMFKVELKFICAEFQIFSTLSKHDITILVIIYHRNRYLTSYGNGLHKLNLDSKPRRQLLYFKYGLNTEVYLHHIWYNMKTVFE